MHIFIFSVEIIPLAQKRNEEEKEAAAENFPHVYGNEFLANGIKTAQQAHTYNIIT